MKLTLHATRPTPLGASRLVREMSAWSVKTPCVLRPGIVGMRGCMGIRLRPCMIMTTPPRAHPSHKTTAMHDNEHTPLCAKLLEVSLLGVGTVLRLEGDAWSMAK